MTVLLKDAIKPNLVQTLEGQPVLMHCGPFANIAHGNNSLIADLIGMKLGDYVVTESGFGADMGMEKFFDIVCRFGKLTPSAAVLVTTVRAIKHHAGLEDDPRAERSAALQAIETGFANVRRHLNTIAHVRRARGRRGQPAARATPTRRSSWSSGSRSRPGAFAAEANEGFTKGGAGVADLASAVVEACEQPNTLPPALPGRRADPGQDRGRRQAGLRRQGRLLLSRGARRSSPSSPARVSATSRCAWPRRTCRCRPTRRC